MDIIKQAHDKLFKETFGKLEIAKDFINGYLPANILEVINLETLDPQKDSFINKELQEVFSDLLFKVDINNKEGYIYFLFEHKSYKDRLAIFQLLRYMIEIWESKIKKENNNSLPVIIPLLIYHNKNKWDIKTSLGQMILGYNELPEAIKRYTPDFEYLIYDLTKYSDDDVRLESITRIIIRIFKNIEESNPAKIIDVLEEGFELLRDVIEKDSITYYLESCLRYVFSVRNDINHEDIIKIVEKVSVEGRELAMTVAQRLKEEGKAEGIKKIAKNAIVKGMDIKDIMELTGLTKTEIEAIRKEMLE